MSGPLKLDEVIHQSTRLAIMSHLAAVGETDFLTVKRLLGLSDGNISVHTGLLEKSGYIETEKSFVGKKTRTTYRLTPAGRRAFRQYVAALETVLKGSADGGG
ncbi:MAG: transcriptional regulator [Armatimonadota bacterium]|nr:transcriptional regulator [Armatimonadota bacterium]